MTRVVRNLKRDGKPAKAVIASRIYDTTAADLWNALTSKERIERWFMLIRSVAICLFEAATEQPDGQKREMVGQSALADEDMLALPPSW